MFSCTNCVTFSGVFWHNACVKVNTGVVVATIFGCSFAVVQDVHNHRQMESNTAKIKRFITHQLCKVIYIEYHMCQEKTAPAQRSRCGLEISGY